MQQNCSDQAHINYATLRPPPPPPPPPPHPPHPSASILQPRHYHSTYQQSPQGLQLWPLHPSQSSASIEQPRYYHSIYQQHAHRLQLQPLHPPQATASTQQPQYYHYIYQQHPQGLQQPQQQHLQYHQPPQPLEPPILERRLPQRPVPRSHGPLEPPQSPSPAELRQRTSKRQRGMSCSAVMPPPPPPRIPQPPPLSVLRHMVIQRRSGTSGSVFGPEPPRPHVPQPPPSCDCCQDLGIVYQERPAERTKTCALCGGVGLVREPSIDAEGVCWHCYGEGETKYTGVDGGWTHCYCKQQRPRPQSSQVAMGSKSL